MIALLVDADGCPVKDEVYRVAKRYELEVTLVANAWLRTPSEDRVKLVVVTKGFDAADDWIVEHARANDIVVTTDIPLAARCLEKGVAVIGASGREFTEDNIGEALASREIASHLRELGHITAGPAPFEKKDRSRFLHQLDRMIQAILRKQEKTNRS